MYSEFAAGFAIGMIVTSIIWFVSINTSLNEQRRRNGRN